MGSPVSQVASSTQPQSKGFQSVAPSNQPSGLPDFVQPNASGQPQGKGSRVTIPGQGGQPRMGVPNNYSNTVGQWDNASIQPRQTQSGKGKGY
jgi:hypothetical protein